MPPARDPSRLLRYGAMSAGSDPIALRLRSAHGPLAPRPGAR